MFGRNIIKPTKILTSHDISSLILFLRMNSYRLLADSYRGRLSRFTPSFVGQFTGQGGLYRVAGLPEVEHLLQTNKLKDSRSHKEKFFCMPNHIVDNNSAYAVSTSSNHAAVFQYLTAVLPTQQVMFQLHDTGFKTSHAKLARLLPEIYLAYDLMALEQELRTDVPRKTKTSSLVFAKDGAEVGELTHTIDGEDISTGIENVQRVFNLQVTGALAECLTVGASSSLFKHYVDSIWENPMAISKRAFKVDVMVPHSLTISAEDLMGRLMKSGFDKGELKSGERFVCYGDITVELAAELESMPRIPVEHQGSIISVVPENAEVGSAEAVKSILAQQTLFMKSRSDKTVVEHATKDQLLEVSETASQRLVV